MSAHFVSVAALGLFVTAAAAQEDLSQWRGRRDVFAVDGATAVGSSHDARVAQNTFLISEREYGDFELTMRVRLDGDNNGGVQYRSRIVDEQAFRVAGYQCDVHREPRYLGMLYDEGGAGVVAERGAFVRWTDEGREVLGELARQEEVDLSRWHTLRITAQGSLMWHELDGRVVTAVQDLRAAAPKRGVLALQVHAGAPMRADYELVALRELGDARVDVPAAVQALLRRAEQRARQPQGAAPQWIWSEDVADDDERFFRRTFALDAVPAAARLAVSCDNHCRVFVNGERVLTDDSWESVAVASVEGALRVGDNVLAVYGWNDGGPAALAVRLSWGEGDDLRELVSDATWRVGDDDPDGWDRVGFDDSGWPAATVLAAVGANGAAWSGVHGDGALGENVDAFLPQVAVLAPDIEVRANEGGGDVIELLDVPRALGSWVSLCLDDRGRLYASDQSAGLYRVVPAARLGETSTIERVPVELGGAHGLLWWRDALYAVVNGDASGLYRVTDTDGDDVLDRVELLQALEGRGEHGPHSVVVAPDGEHLLVVCGNHTSLPPLAKNFVPHELREDRLIPRLDDPHPYWEGHSPPGGWVCRCDANGERWELLCCGFRNPYDLVVRPDGLVVTYDADMEWDMGLPWYRPTRYLLVREGVDYGWRIGSAKWPADYPDAPPALHDIGPGSPCGMALQSRATGAFWALDWTFGTAYLGEAPRVVAAPWPVADVAVSPLGSYVVSGGRGLPSRLVRLPIGDDRIAHADVRLGWAPAPWPDLGDATIEQLLQRALVFPVAARIELERRPVAQWRAAALRSRSPYALLALARHGAPTDLDDLLAALQPFDFARAEHALRIAWLRVHAVALLRLGPPSDAQRQLVADRLLPLLPTGDERVDQDLVELLACVDAPGLLDRAVPLLATLQPSPPPPWAETASRNAQYGGVIDKMLANMPPIGQIAIADALRTVKRGWTLEQRRTFFAFLGQARTRSGGSSYDGYLQKIVDAAWQTCTAAERAALAEVVDAAKRELVAFVPTPPKGPGRAWQLTDADELLRGGLRRRDLVSGHNLFWAVGCASCHQFAGEGGSGGPDLTSLGNKFTPRDVFAAIVTPSAVVSEQYTGHVVTLKDGAAHFGVARKTYDGDVEVYEVIPAAAHSAPLRIPVADVASVVPSPRSPMPEGLVNALSADELRDLLAFLVSRGAR